MTTEISILYSTFSKWLNDNQGVVSVGLFLLTIALGFFSGIFSSLRKKPKFKISLNQGPTFCCTFKIDKEYEGFKVHRTGFALYLVVANTGSAPSSIEKIEVAYHWNLRPFSMLWLKYSVGWFWLKNMSVALADFRANIGKSVKIYPFLTQINYLSPASPKTFLEIGRSTNGVVYFEQSDSWGGCYPIIKDKKVHIKVRLTDVFGKHHTKRFTIP